MRFSRGLVSRRMQINNEESFFVRVVVLFLLTFLRCVTNQRWIVGIYIHTIRWTSKAVSCSSLVYKLRELQNDQACLLIHIKLTPNEFWTNTNTRSNSIIWTISPNRIWHLWLEDGLSGLLYQICIFTSLGFCFDLPLFSNAQDYEKLYGLLAIDSKHSCIVCDPHHTSMRVSKANCEKTDWSLQDYAS